MVYQSDVNGLIASDQNGLKDIFAYDRATGVTTLISKNNAGEAANNASYKPTVSADGRFVSFESLATNLDSERPDTNQQADVFVHDRKTGVTTRLSVDALGNEGSEDGPSPNFSFNPYMIKDGSAVLYRTSIDITPDSERWGWNLFTSTVPMCLSGNTAPIVQITAPSAPQTLEVGNPTTLSAQAIDNENGDLSTSIQWTSSIDGNLGTGAGLSPTLSEGVHTLEATVLDLEGLAPEFVATQVITVTQGAPQ